MTIGRSQVHLGGVLPINHIGELQFHLDFAFVEPISNPRYVDFYRNNYHGIKILDNSHGTYGKDPASCEKLAEYASAVGANEVIAPDKLGDWSFNNMWAKEFSKHWPKAKTLVCLGGPFPGGFQLQADHVRSSGYAGVCLPYRLNRCYGNYGGRVHLLGLKCPEQYDQYLGEDKHVTLDTSEPISAAMRGVHYATDGGLWTVKRPLGYIEAKMTKGELNRAIDNIQFLKQWIQERSHPVPV